MKTTKSSAKKASPAKAEANKEEGVSVSITNAQAQYLYNWLDIPLHGEQARMRTKFCRMIQPQYAASLDKRQEILGSYADKDKDGKPVLENGLFKISDAKMAKAREAVGKFIDEKTSYAVTPETKPWFAGALAALSESKIPMQSAESGIYDDVMDLLEFVAK